MKTVKRTNDECEAAMTNGLKTAEVAGSPGHRGDHAEAADGLLAPLDQSRVVLRLAPCRRVGRDAQSCCLDSRRTVAG